MSKHTLTVTITFEVPDDAYDEEATVGALESATNSMLDEGTLQDWILDAAGDFDDFDDETESISASCVLEKAKTTK